MGKKYFSQSGVKWLEKYTGHQAFSLVTSCCFEVVVLSFFASFGEYSQWLEGFSLQYIEKYNKASLANKTTQNPHKHKSNYLLSYKFQLECAEMSLACGPQSLQEFDHPC